MAVVLFGAACADEPTKPDPLPPPVDQGVNAYIVVDNLHAAVGQTVKVSVVVRAADANVKVGSFTGRLHFDAASLQYKAEVGINDGLRVANANGAGTGEIRFAGASATGFADLTLYSATFTVKQANWTGALTLQMEELSAAKSLVNLSPQLQVQRRVFAAEQVKP
jgi:hypothetical protein